MVATRVFAMNTGQFRNSSNTYRCTEPTRNRRGLITITNAVAILVCALLLHLLMNVAIVQHRKVYAQNTADAVAYSSAVWQARAMNAITTTNHVIGEVTGLVIVHEAIGGQKLEKGEQGDTRQQDQNLKIAKEVAEALGFNTFAYPTVSKKVKAEATILDHKNALKEVLTWVYAGGAVAKIMQFFPPTAPAGRALETVLLGLQAKILQEYIALNVLEFGAKAVLPVKISLRDLYLPAAKKYTTSIVNLTPLVTARVAKDIASMNEMKGVVFPSAAGVTSQIGPPLPVKIDPLAKAQAIPTPEEEQPFPEFPADPAPESGEVANLVQGNGGGFQLPAVNPNQYFPPVNESCGCPSVPADNQRAQIVKTTQLARASFPWVNYHREPIIRYLELSATIAVLTVKAKSKYFTYKEYTEKYSKELCDEFQTKSRYDLGLYVMEGYVGPDKGFELWNFPQHSDIADDLFTMVGLVYVPKPQVAGFSIFGQPMKDGSFTYAQAMIYNANDQERPRQKIDLNCKRIVPIRQANVGWDTLNWAPGSNQNRESCNQANGNSGSSDPRPFELIGKGTRSQYPSIQVNWQAKLTPGTQRRLAQVRILYRTLPNPLSSAVRRQPLIVPGTLTTH